MINHSDILQLCRLCLVEEKVNHSIFEEAGGLRGIFLKITSCLPVSISQDDSLPKKICDSCSSKLDTFYQFWNETANAEKQLLQWLNQTTLGPISKAGQTETKNKMDAAEVKEETIDVVEASYEEEMRLSTDAKSYVLQQQQLPYSAPPPKVRPAVENNETEEPASKRPRRASAMKALEHMGSEDEDDPEYDGDNYTKAETDDSEKDDDDEEDETYQEGPSTSMDDQPGPSGMGKGTTEAPSGRNHITQTNGREGEIQEILDSEDEGTEKAKTEQEDDCLIKLKCPQCEERFSYNCEFLYHYKSCHEVVPAENVHIRPLHEEQNGKIAPSQDVIGPDEGYGCEFCARRFSTRKGLGKHRSIRHRDKRYTCNVCSQDVPSALSLELHMKSHSGVRPFQCFECGRNFSARKFLAVHQRVHSSDKPYTCELCYKSFTQKSTLTVHLRYHSGERPYVCEVCNKGFVTRTLMKKHLRTHGIP